MSPFRAVILYVKPVKPIAEPEADTQALFVGSCLVPMGHHPTHEELAYYNQFDAKGAVFAYLTYN